MIEISKNANKNYLCKVVKINNLRAHHNADRLQIVSIDFQDVITGLNIKKGDICIYFPLESKINKNFLSFTNSFRDKELNDDNKQTGFFESNCRVKAVRLRGEKSMGYIVPVEQVEEFVNFNEDINDYINQEFDIINGIKLVEKYQVKAKEENRTKQGKKPKLSRLIDGQVHLHTDTENLRKNIHKINLEDTISITYKTHGTSWWCANVLVKKKLNWLEKTLKWLGYSISDEMYDIVYGSRRVVKNSSFEDPKGKDHYFGYDLWEDIKNEIADKIPKGYTVYGECLGFTKDGKYIQSGYDYGCRPVLEENLTQSQYRKFWKDLYSDEERIKILSTSIKNFNIDNIKILNNLKYVAKDLSMDENLLYPLVTKRDNRPQNKLEIYRITHTTPDGLVTELSYPEIVEFCERAGLTPSHLFYYGNTFLYLTNLTREGIKYNEEDWREKLVKFLESKYNEKDCFMCNNKVPEEGIVLRKESLFYCESYKLKSFNFLKKESDELDKEIQNIEEI